LTCSAASFSFLSLQNYSIPRIPEYEIVRVLLRLDVLHLENLLAHQMVVLNLLAEELKE
jgi:hypothetical protein